MTSNKNTRLNPEFIHPIEATESQSLTENEQITDTTKSKLHQLEIDIISSMFSGKVVCFLFHPMDRAIFLSMKSNRAFLRKENFSNPYQAFPQALAQRAFLNGIYFTFQGQLRLYLYPYLRNELGTSEPVAQFGIGMIAGSISGLLTNGISATKYYAWGNGGSSFVQSTREMWCQGGIRPFLKGAQVTIKRDIVFSGAYEMLRSTLRNNLPKTMQQYVSTYLNFVCNTVAAGLATVVSGPLNYARAMQYATLPDEKPPTIRESLNNVWRESKVEAKHPLAKIGFFQQRFMIGWGAGRVAVGIAAGQYFFDKSREVFGSETVSSLIKP